MLVCVVSEAAILWAIADRVLYGFFMVKRAALESTYTWIVDPGGGRMDDLFVAESVLSTADISAWYTVACGGRASDFRWKGCLGLLP